MPRVQELEGRQPGTGPAAGELRPLNLPAVLKSLEHRGKIIDLLVRVQRVFTDPQLISLTLHHVDRIMQDPLHKVIAQLGHQHVGSREMVQSNRQRSHMVMVAVGQYESVQLLSIHEIVARQTGPPLPFRVRSSIEQQAVSFEFHPPGSGSNIRIRIQVCDLHPLDGTTLTPIIRYEFEDPDSRPPGQVRTRLPPTGNPAGGDEIFMVLTVAVVVDPDLPISYPYE